LEAPEDEKPKLNLVTKDVLSDLDRKYLLHERTAHPGIEMELQLSTTNSEQLNTSARYEKAESWLPMDRPCHGPFMLDSRLFSGCQNQVCNSVLELSQMQCLRNQFVNIS